ncbi:MAG: TM1812 family CRISPR-associated protein [Chthonomonadales bacterium]|nr:TM1812 family CRISPR-associated protein [Chthonomonadales bacterium]
MGVDHLITQLGTGRYEETTYVWGEREPVRARLFPVAACRWLQPRRVSVLLTEKARANENWADLQAALEGTAEVADVEVPDGRSEDELWSTMDAIRHCAADGETLALDVTHGFRTGPMVALLSAAFLGAIHNGPTIGHVLYGAYEARDTATDRSPTFDLTPFLRVLGWTHAARVLADGGDARPLTALLKEYDRPAGHSRHEPELRSAGKSLARLSAALAVARPREVREEAGKALRLLGEAPAGLSARSAPFAAASSSLRGIYEGLDAADLEGASRLVAWYAERNRAMEAILLAREWTVSLAGEAAGIADRDAVEHALGAAVAARRPRAEEPGEAGPLPPARACPTFEDEEWRELVDWWERIHDLRNDVAHCGYRASARTTDTIMKEAGKLYNSLAPLLARYGRKETTT